MKIKTTKITEIEINLEEKPDRKNCSIEKVSSNFWKVQMNDQV